MRSGIPGPPGREDEREDPPLRTRPDEVSLKMPVMSRAGNSLPE